MFGNLELAVFDVEVLTDSYFLRAKFQPRGDLIVFLNDARWRVFSFTDVEMFPLAGDRKIPGIKQATVNVRKDKILAVNVLTSEDASKIQMLATKRPILVYTDRFAFQGNVHVNADSSDSDLFDDKWLFYPFSDATIFPVRETPTNPTKKVAISVFNQTKLDVYYVVHK